MISLLEALRSKRADEGFSLVEVVVAMVILALVATGITAGTGMVVKFTADTRARQVAINLAEQQLDLDRGVLDPFDIHPFGGAASTPAKTQVVSGRTYTVTQTTSLVTTDGTDITCGSGKTIYYRRITVSVDWSGRLPTTNPVQSDTILAPNGRINDASTGSIAVLVTGANGMGQAGVTVRIDPASGTSTPLQTQPDVTDVDGCTYALGVYPGNYTVTISRAGYVDTTQVASPSKTVPVTVGATASQTFTYDQASNYTLKYPAGATLPNNLPVTFLKGTGTSWTSSSTAAAPTTAALFPYSDGWTAIAGVEADNGVTKCAAQDPSAWKPGTYNGKTYTVGSRGNVSAPGPGGSGTLTVPMGVFSVKPVSALYLTAVAQDVSTNGQPGCANASTQTYTFPSRISTSTTTLALPYGTYKLYSGNVLSALTNLVGTSLGLTAVTDPVTGALATFDPQTNILTLDPRPSS